MIRIYGKTKRQLERQFRWINLKIDILAPLLIMKDGFQTVCNRTRRVSNEIDELQEEIRNQNLILNGVLSYQITSNADKIKREIKQLIMQNEQYKSERERIEKSIAHLQVCMSRAYVKYNIKPDCVY